MNTERNNKLKHILIDPAGEYSKQNPDYEKNKLKILNDLAKEHASLKSEFASLDSRTKELSGKIGFLKKEGKDIDELKKLMRLYSRQKTDILQKSQNIETKILEFFKSESYQNLTSATTTETSNNHIYPDKIPYTEKITIKLLGDEYGRWNSYVANNKAASFYHVAEWRDVINKSFGHNGYYLYAIDQNNNIKGILPLIYLKSRLFGKFFVSMPYFNYGGAIADHPDIEIMLMNAAEEYAAGLSVAHIEYRDDIARSKYSAREDKVNMILPLPSCKEDLWESFTPKLRAQIKRPQRENIEIQHGRANLLNAFYSVFARNMRDLGTPVYGKSFFYNILDAFPTQSSILTVSLGGNPVAAAFLLGYGNTLEIPWASSLRTVNHLSINMILYWEVLSYAVENNFKYFDFGRSSKHGGTYKFKKQWGAKPKQLYWHYWLSPGEKMPSLNPNNPKFQLLINIWKRIPVTLTKLIGPGIVKNLP